jgi:hypothetical protein
MHGRPCAAASRQWCGMVPRECPARSSPRALPCPGKFSEQSACGRHVGRMGGLRGREISDKPIPPVLANLGTPLSRIAIQTDPLESGRVVLRTRPVGTVGRPSRAPQIVPAIVGPVHVAMIDHRPTPFTSHVQPSEMVGFVNSTAHSDVPITGDLVHPSSNIPDCNGIARTLSPTKIPAFGVVVQQFAQPRLGQSRAPSHGALAQTKRAAKAALGNVAVDGFIRRCT